MNLRIISAFQHEVLVCRLHHYGYHLVQHLYKSVIIRYDRAMDKRMNVIFLHPELLILAPVVAVGGWLLLRNVSAPEIIFPILDFWPEDTPRSAGRQKRFPEWPWMLILLAAILATIALSSPRLQWRSVRSAASSSVHLLALARSEPGSSESVDVFVKAAPVHDGSNYTLVIAAHHRIIRRLISATALTQGCDVTFVPAAPILTIALMQNNRTLAQLALSRSSGMLKVSAHFIGSPPPAFLRLLAAMPSISFHGHIRKHGLWIIHQRKFNPTILRGITDSAIILLGDTPGPGLRPQAELMLTHPQTPATVSRERLMRFVSSSGIMVKKLIQAHFNSSWYPLMEVNNHTWLAQSDDATRHITWLWLAGQMNSSWNTWPHHASFVIFFANVIAQLQSLPGSVRQGHWWRSTTPDAAGAQAVPPITPKVKTLNINIFMAVLICACLLAAIFGFVNVNRHVR